MKALRVLALAALAFGGLAGAGAEGELGDEGRTPPRLAWTDGAPSFLRAGAEAWAPARVNLPLAPGDRLDTGESGALEVQLGARDFLRAAARTELALEAHTPGLLQLRVGAGRASFDLRSLPAGQAIAVGTPHAVFTIEAGGDYRIEVGDAATTFAARRGGSAALALAAGPPVAVGANEQVIVSAEHVERRAAPAPDDWDRWSALRSDDEQLALSTRYAGHVYGARDLDRHGSWRTVAPFGPIWLPRVHAGWAPYATGRWIWDPHFGWSWLDDAPWGWAPFHHGRWIFLHGRWAWAPGPVGPRLVYAPALVAFYGSHRTRVLWVPLGWGEPIRPWWGPRRWIGQPHWLGWSGPRIRAGTYANAKLAGGAIAVPGAAFGRVPVASARIPGARPGALRLVHGALPVERTRMSLVGAEERVGAPLLSRPVASPYPARGIPSPRLAPAPRLGPQPRMAPPAVPKRIGEPKLPKGVKTPKGTAKPRPGPIVAPGGEAPGGGGVRRAPGVR